MASEKTHLDSKRVRVSGAAKHLSGPYRSEQASNFAKLWMQLRATIEPYEQLLCPLAGPLARSIADLSSEALLHVSMSFSIIRGVPRCSMWYARNDPENSRSLLLGDDLDLLVDGNAPLFLVDHNLEALKITEVLAGVPCSELLGEGGGSPLVSEIGLLGGLSESASASAASNGNLHLGKRDSLQWHNRSWEVLSLNEDTVRVGDVNNSDLLAVVVAEVNEANSASFHEVFVSL